MTKEEEFKQRQILIEGLGERRHLILAGGSGGKGSDRDARGMPIFFSILLFLAALLLCLAFFCVLVDEKDPLTLEQKETIQCSKHCSATGSGFVYDFETKKCLCKSRDDNSSFMFPLFIPLMMK